MILVTGSAGNLGARLVRGLVEKGRRVRALVLPGDPLVSRLDAIDCQLFEGDIAEADSLTGAFDGVDTVYHLAAVILSHDPGAFERVNVRGTRNLLEGATRAGARHFVYVSSASVVYPRTTPYSESKRECERLVTSQTSLTWTIVRPTLVYERGGGQEFMLFWEYLKKFPVVPFVGNGRARKNPVHADDLIQGLVAIAGNDKARNKTYNLCGGEEIRIRDLARLMLRYEGGPRPFLPVPVPACRFLAAALGVVMKRPPLSWNAIAGVTQDANLDRSSAYRDLGYNPVGVHEGFQRCFSAGR